MNTKRSVENETMSPMDSATLAAATLRLVASENASDRARRQLHAQQRAAILGGGDDIALDDAVLAYRAARAAQATAEAEWRREYAARRSVAPMGAPVPQGTGAAQAPRAREAAEPVRPPAPEERFVRWLAEAAGREVSTLAA
jgi:hypothetical protein